MRIQALALLGLLAVAPPVARAQIACTGPDVLCTGDPCVAAGTISVASPCDLDFGTRTLVIQGGVRVPDAGVLRLTAGAIEVRTGGVQGGAALGGDVTLVSAGNIVVRGPVNVSGSTLAGTATLQAGGDVAIVGSLKAITGPLGIGSSGTLIVEAQGRISVDRAAHIDVRGSKNVGAGRVALRARAGSWLTGHLDGGGAVGGDFEFSSADGDVYMGTDIRAKATAGTGGTTRVLAGTTVTLARGIRMEGRGGGGVVEVEAPTVMVQNELVGMGRDGAGGQVRVRGGQVTVSGNLRASGGTAGGTVDVEGDLTSVTGSIDVRGRTGPGGRIDVVATAGDLALRGRGDAGAGGVISASASGGLLVAGRYRAAPGGCIALAAGGALQLTGATFDPPPAPVCP